MNVGSAHTAPTRGAAHSYACTRGARALHDPATPDARQDRRCAHRLHRHRAPRRARLLLPERDLVGDLVVAASGPAAERVVYMAARSRGSIAQAARFQSAIGALLPRRQRGLSRGATRYTPALRLVFYQVRWWRVQLHRELVSLQVYLASAIATARSPPRSSGCSCGAVTGTSSARSCSSRASCRRRHRPHRPPLTSLPLRSGERQVRGSLDRCTFAR